MILFRRGRVLALAALALPCCVLLAPVTVAADEPPVIEPANQDILPQENNDPAAKAEKLRAALQAERDRLQAELGGKEAVVRYLRRWVVSTPQDRLREVRPGAESRTRHLAGIHRRKQIVLDRVMAFPWESRGSIASGEALNAMLDACGETAAHAVEIRAMREDPALAVARNEPNVDQFTKLEIDQELEYRDSLKLDPNSLRHLQFTRGLIGSKLSSRLNEEPLELEWPLALRDPRFDDHRRGITVLRDKAMQELETSKGITFKTAMDLKDAVDRLYAAVQAHEGRLARQRGDVNEWLMYNRGLAHVDRLKHSVVRFAQAERLEDVAPAKFDGETVEELIAHLHSNGMRFNRADVNGEDAYYKVFRQMVRYYVEMQFQNTILESSEVELARLASMDDMEELAERVLFNREYGLPLTEDEVRASITDDAKRKPTEGAGNSSREQ